ncbi:N-acetylglucosamine-6-phosphate deacetylase [Bacillaceae bacterium S4-13-56]
MNNLIITNCRIYQENKVIDNGFIEIREDKIYKVGVMGDFVSENKSTINAQGLTAIPGFIDGHIHGVNGADVMDATSEALDVMCKALPREGTTSFLATTITQSPEKIDAALKNIARFQNKRGQAEMIGVHLEGPFIAVEKAGAQPREYILEPNLEQFQKWQSLANGYIKTITMAPEHDQTGEFISYLYEKGVNVSAGHTSATHTDMKKAVEHGVRQVTHICNACSGIHHREIGVVGSALLMEELRSELIADGVHVSPEMVELIYKNVGSDRVILITDGMRAKCLSKGTYDLGGQNVTVSGDRAALRDGTLAGSILRMIDGVKNMFEFTEATVRDVIRMASENPAKQLGVFSSKGSLEVGKDADIVLVSEDFTISHTICRGQIAYQEGDQS